MLNRVIKISKSRSFFLFGARATGKSTLLEQLFPPEAAIWIDLLNPDLEDMLMRQPEDLEKILSQKSAEWVVIDEIQKVPSLLSLVHKLIRKRKYKFALSGSSARKLKRGGADMLAGRASYFELFPLTAQELAGDFDLNEVMNWGSLPEIFSLSEVDRKHMLRSYVQTYLKEEIIVEQIIRKIKPFRIFLEIAALQNGQIINYSKTAHDLGVDTTTIQNYYEILKDTLLGFSLEPFHESVRKRQRQNPKFYFFDLGVKRALTNELESPLVPQTSPYGRAFEHFVILEIYRWSRYHGHDWRFSYLTTKDGAEVDLIIDTGPRKRLAIEIKSSTKVDQKEVRAFSRLAADVPGARAYFISNDPLPEEVEGVSCLHWREFMKRQFSV